MHNERGQASVEWVGLVLLLGLALAALLHFAPRPDPAEVGSELLHTLACATRGGCTAGAAGGAPRAPGPRLLVTAPPVVPVAPRERRAPVAAPRPRALPAPLARGRALVRQAGRRAGAVYRRSWMFCLGYERVRYDILHPESSVPGEEIPLSESLRMANDCVSPVDLVRDYELLRGRP
jgi:hypothetical protein